MLCSWGSSSFSAKVSIYPNWGQQTGTGVGEVKYPAFLPLTFFSNKRESHMNFLKLMPKLDLYFYQA